MASRAHLPSPQEEEVEPQGGGRLPAGVEAELAEGGQQSPVCALGQQSLRASFIPAALSKILSREKVTLQVPFTELLLHAICCAGYFMNIGTDPHKEPTHFIDGETDAQRFSHLSKVTQILCNHARDDWIDGSEWMDVRLVGTEEEERSERRKEEGCGTEPAPTPGTCSLYSSLVIVPSLWDQAPWE